MLRIKKNFDHRPFMLNLDYGGGLVESFDWSESIDIELLIIKYATVVSLSGIDKLVNLKILDLRYIYLKDNDFSYLQNLTKLENLSLRMNDYQESDLDLSNIVNLQNLVICSDVNKIKLTALVKLNKLSIYDYYNCLEVDDITGKSIKDLYLHYSTKIPYFENLQVLNIGKPSTTKYNLYKVRLSSILFKNMETNYKFENFKLRIKKSKYSIKLMLSKIKIQHLWTKFLLSKNKDGLSRLSYLAYYF